MPVTLSRCRVRSAYGNEQILVASTAVAEGDPLLIETPLATVPVGAYRWGTYNWDLVDLLLTNRSLLQQYTRAKLSVTTFLLDMEDLAVEAALMQRHKLSRQRVRSLYMDIATNNIGVLDRDETVLHSYGLFETMSRSDHSCVPTARLVPTGGAGGEMSLVARKALKAGDPVTWSYFRENEFLQADFDTRNFNLVNNFRFACRCERCTVERPPELAHIRDLVAYFDRRIQEAALELVKSPEGVAAVIENSPMELHRRALRLANS